MTKKNMHKTNGISSKDNAPLGVFVANVRALCSSQTTDMRRTWPA